MAGIQIPAGGWQPRQYQWPTWGYFEAGGLRSIDIWHRRGGKDDVALHHHAVAALNRPGTYWHCLPEYAHARRVLWDAVDAHKGRRRIDLAFPPEIVASRREDTMQITFINGSVYQVVGSDKIDGLVGAGIAGVTFSEWALAKPESWGLIRPMVLETKGWAHFITTPRGRNHAFRMFRAAQDDPTWNATRVGADISNVFTKQELDYELKQYIDQYGEDIGKALFKQEYLCSFEGANESGFITTVEIQTARARNIEMPQGPRVLGVDPARFGADRSVILGRIGPKIDRIITRRGIDTVQLAGEVSEVARSWGAQVIFVDGAGVGAGVVDQLKALGWGPKLVEVQSGGRPLAPERYYNLRAEMWGKMKDWLANRGDISAAPFELDEDLTSIGFEFDSKGRVKLESKDDVKSRGMPSPDLADALSLTFARDVAMDDAFNQQVVQQRAVTTMSSFSPAARDYGMQSKALTSRR